MLLKALAGTAKDLWQRRLLPAQLRASVTRMAFAEILDQCSDSSMSSLVLSLCGDTARGVVATVSFDRVDTLKPVFYGDFVRVEGEVVAIGNSSMAIQVDGFRYDKPSNAFERTHSALVTMVAVDRFMRARSGLPRLVDDDTERFQKLQEATRQRAELARQWREEQEAVDALEHASSDMLPPATEKKDALVAVSETEVEMRNWFLPHHMNANNVMFGGDVLSWMEKAALHCAKKFAKSDRMVAVSVDRVTFKLPITSVDVVTFKARVVSVRHADVEVEVEVFVEPVDAVGARKSHTGYFTIRNVSDANEPVRIATGLLVDEANQTDLRALLKSQRRRALKREHQSQDPLEISVQQSRL